METSKIETIETIEISYDDAVTALKLHNELVDNSYNSDILRANKVVIDMSIAAINHDSNDINVPLLSKVIVGVFDNKNLQRTYRKDAFNTSYSVTRCVLDVCRNVEIIAIELLRQNDDVRSIITKTTLGLWIDHVHKVAYLVFSKDSSAPYPNRGVLKIKSRGSRDFNINWNDEILLWFGISGAVEQRDSTAAVIWDKNHMGWYTKNMDLWFKSFEMVTRDLRNAYTDGLIVPEMLELMTGFHNDKVMKNRRMGHLHEVQELVPFRFQFLSDIENTNAKRMVSETDWSANPDDLLIVIEELKTISPPVKRLDDIIRLKWRGGAYAFTDTLLRVDLYMIFKDIPWSTWG